MGASHTLLAGDAGQELWEEVSVVVRGGNYGWNVKEGTHCFDAENPTVSPASCPNMDHVTGEVLRDLVIEFANSKHGGLALTVVGGHVYRGRDVPSLRGMYVYGGAATLDPGPSGRVFASMPQSSGRWTPRELLVDGTDPVGYVVKGFGQDRDGEVYVTGSEILGPSGTTGAVLTIVQPDEP